MPVLVAVFRSLTDNVAAACCASHMSELLELVAVDCCLGVAKGKRLSRRGASGMHFMLHKWCKRATIHAVLK